MGDIFFQITIIICLAAVLSFVFRAFKQPAIVAYLVAGIVITHIIGVSIESQQVLHNLADLGITLLLFMLGLEIKLSELPSIGRTALLVGIGQIVLTFIFGYFLSLLFGFPQTAAVYIGIALTFSSTIVAVKLLSDKKDLFSLYGKIAVGVLLIQDFFAILLLVMLSGFTKQETSPVVLTNLVLLLYKVGVLFAVIIYLSENILPKILRYVARNSETLFLFSLAWVFGLAAFVSSPFMGFSIEIGGFLAGLALAQSPENYQIAVKMRTLRDFFVILFFVLLGMQMNFANSAGLIVPAIVLSAFVLLIHPVSVMLIMGFMGYRKRTSFLSGIAISPISEFSLILVFLALKLGHISNNIVSLMTLVAIITFISSTYLIMYSNNLYRVSRKYLGIFERKDHAIEDIGEVGNLEDHIVLIGAHRMGESIVATLSEGKDKLLVVDFNPDVVAKLKKKKIQSVFGDIVDSDIQERAQIHKAKLVVSTIPDVDDNILLVKSLNKINRRAKVVVMAQNKDDAKDLYKAGADYVVIPHLAGGNHIANLLKTNDLEKLNGHKEELYSFL